MRALVTGGAGFLGSVLVDRLLAEGHAVDVIDDLSTGSLANLADARADAGGAFSFHRLDVRGPEVIELLAHRRPEVVFHLAGHSGARASLSRPLMDAEVNILGSLQVLEAARLAGVRKVVYPCGAASLYGAVEAKQLPVTEAHAPRPATPHGVAAKAVWEYLSMYRVVHGLEFTALALGHVYGPRQDPGRDTGVVAILAGNLLAGRPCTIFGDGRQTLDLVFVDDVVDALARAGEKGSGLLINVGTGVETSVNDLFGLIGAAAETASPATYLPARPGEAGRHCLNPARAELHLGWKAWTTVDAGVDATVRWLRDQPGSSGS